MVVTEVQRGLCTDGHWAQYPKCRSCDRKQPTLDLCRFRGFRAICDGDQQFVKAVDPTEQGSNFSFTPHIPERLPSHIEEIKVNHSSVAAVGQIMMLELQTVTAQALLPVIKEELKHISHPNIHFRPFDITNRITCGEPCLEW
jgi:hypothetical protein